MGALNRFLARLSDRCERLFKLLRVADGWKCTPDSEKSFQCSKEVLARLPVLAKVRPKESFYLYYVVSKYAVSLMLLKKDEEGIQHPIFFTSKVLRGVKPRYFEVEKR